MAMFWQLNAENDTNVNNFSLPSGSFMKKDTNNDLALNFSADTTSAGKEHRTNFKRNLKKDMIGAAPFSQ